MSESLPQFRYHPDPVATGAVERSPTKCECCGRARDYIYRGPVYSKHELKDALCPWCIADGSAADKFSASFVDDHYLIRANLEERVIEEVCRRTPSYSGWQQETWFCHCGDACEYHGDATAEDIEHASAETVALWQRENPRIEWSKATRGYVTGSSPSFYKFVCRHCHMVLFGWDFT